MQKSLVPREGIHRHNIWTHEAKIKVHDEVDVSSESKDIYIF